MGGHRGCERRIRSVEGGAGSRRNTARLCPVHYYSKTRLVSANWVYRKLGFRESWMLETGSPRRTLLGPLRHTTVTTLSAPVRCLRGSPFGIRPLGGGEFRPFGGCPISLLLPFSRGEEIGEQRQTNGSQRHREGQRKILPIPQSPPSLLQSPSVTERKNVE
jgi:hypothetical protein